VTIPRAFLYASLLSASVGAFAQAAPEPCATAICLFAAVEDSWAASDADRLASMVDTTSVRIGIKPGTPLATAATRVAVAFLLQDQLRLVHTQSCRASALWTGDWGGRQGTRTVRVALSARPQGGRWLLTGIRAED
jgi:hypothetical protein